MRRLVEEHEKVTLLLSKKQIDLVFEHTFADDDLLDALRIAGVAGAKRKVQLTLDELDDLNGHVAAAANHCDDRGLRRKLDEVYEAIEKVERRYEIRA